MDAVMVPQDDHMMLTQQFHFQVSGLVSASQSNGSICE